MKNGEKLYFYREGNSGDYPEYDNIRLFPTKDRAMSYMKERVEKKFSLEWEDFVEEYKDSSAATIEPFMVSVPWPGHNDIQYFIVDTVTYDAS